MQNEASFAGILRELASLLSGAWREVAIYTLVVGGVTAVGIATGLGDPAPTAFDFGFELGTDDSPASTLFDLAVIALGFVANYCIMKRYLAVKGRLQAVGNRFWPYLGMAILSALGIVVGLILLIVPGIILLARWSAASGYVIGAGHGVGEALSSSWRATSGHGWAIFFAALALFFGVVMAAGAIGAIFGAISLATVDTSSAFVEAASGAIFAGFGIAIYCVVQDDTQQLSEVFA